MTKQYLKDVNREYKIDESLPEGVNRIAIGVEYNGRHYHGWQRQPHHNTIAGNVEQALSSVANHPILTVCAGRTDSGVHATQQVAHFDTTAIRQEKSWIQGCNRLLPRDISITWAKSVPAQFHARFSAKTRSYKYIIDNSMHRPALLTNQVTWEHRLLNADAMNEAAQLLIGTHDFTSFRAQGCQAHSPIRTILDAKVERYQQLIVFNIEANAFLYHMIRNIMGTLIPIGLGYQSIDQFKTIFQRCNRSNAGNTAAAYGLYLSAVSYPKNFKIPESKHPLLSLLT